MLNNILRLLLLTLLCGSWLVITPADGKADNKVYRNSAEPQVELFVTSW